MSLVRKLRRQVELRVAPPSLPATFILLTAGRSGSNALLDLLRSHPDVYVGREELFRDGDPHALIHAHRPDHVVRVGAAEAVDAAPGAAVWGWSVHPRQFAAQGIDDPAAWCRRQHEAGVRFITLVRLDALASGISSALATASGEWHQTAGSGGGSSGPVVVDPFIVLEQATTLEDDNDDVVRFIGDLSHLSLVYERDLLDADAQQATADAVFRYLGLPPHRAETRYRRAPRSLAERIANWDEVAAAIRASGRTPPP